MTRLPRALIRYAKLALSVIRRSESATGTQVDTATYFTGIIMFLLSVITVAVLIVQLGGSQILAVVTFIMVLTACAASYTVAQL